jgi:O-antigen/teichoic acid export membrane protein
MQAKKNQSLIGKIPGRSEFALLGGLFKLLSFDFLGKIIPFILFPIYLKIMSQEEFGQFSLFLQVGVACGSLMMLGTESVLGKFFFDTNPLYTKGQIMASILAISTSVLIFIFAVNGIFQWAFPDSYLQLLTKNLLNFSSTWLIIFGIFISGFSILVQNYFMMLEKPLVFLKFNFLRITCGIILFFLIYKVAENKAVFRFSIESFTSFFVLFPLLILSIRKYDADVKISAIKSLIAEGVPFFSIALSALIYGLADKLIVFDKLGSDQLAIYNLCIYFILPLNFFMVSFNQLWLPRIYKESEISENVRRMVKTSRTLLLLFSLAGLGFWLLLFLLFKFALIPSGYQYAIVIFPIVFFARLFDTVGGMHVGVFLKYNQMWKYAFLNIITGVGILVANLSYIESFSLLGVTIIAAFFSILRYIGIKLIFYYYISS